LIQTSKESATITLPSLEKQHSSTSLEATSNFSSIIEDFKIQSTTDTSEVSLPPIASKPCSNVEQVKEFAAQSSSLVVKHLPPIFEQLDQISFSEHDSNEESTTDDSDSDNDNSNDNTEESIDTDVIDQHVEKYSKLRMAGKQPGLTILQYVTQSESMFYNYFSIKNKEAVEKRITKVREKSPGQKDVMKQTDSKLCQFCGEPVKEISLLEIIQKQKDEIEDEPVCPAEYNCVQSEIAL